MGNLRRVSPSLLNVSDLHRTIHPYGKIPVKRIIRLKGEVMGTSDDGRLTIDITPKSSIFEEIMENTNKRLAENFNVPFELLRNMPTNHNGHECFYDDIKIPRVARAAICPTKMPVERYIRGFFSINSK